MKDINIKTIIANMYSVILSILFIIILSLILLFGLLLHGIKVNNLYLTHFKVKQLYIKWDKGLIVTADRIYIQKNKSVVSNTKQSYIHDAFTGVHYLQQLSDILKKVYVKDFVFNGTHSVIDYNINKPSYVNVASPTWMLKSMIQTKQKNIYIHLLKLVDKKLNINVFGNVILRHKDRSLHATLTTILDSNTSLLLALSMKQNIMTYKLSGDNNITDIQKILHHFPIPDSISPWIFENALHVKSITLHNLQGYINLNNPAGAFKHLSLSMNLNHISYKFDKNLASIVSPRTTLTMQNGIIKIYPHNAMFLNQPLQKSWLYIDPLGKDPLIGIYILGNIQLNKQLTSLLHYYNIQVPFVQEKSTIHTYLQLIMHLNHFHIDTDAVFKTNDSLFNYHGHLIHIFKSDITLHNSLLNIKQLTITDHNDTKADVIGAIDFQKQQADITCKIDKMRYNIAKHDIVLKTSPLTITYNQIPLSAKVNIPSSVWLYQKQLITVKKASIAINTKSDTISIPKTLINVNNKINFFLQGHINTQEQTGTLNANLIKFNFHSIKLKQINLPLQLDYNRSILLKSNHLSRWMIGETNLTLGSASIQLNKNKLFILPFKFSTDKNISAQISGIYNLKNKTGDIYIQKLVFNNPALKQILHNKHSLSLKLADKNQIIHLSSKQFGTDVALFPDYWEANIDLSKLAHFIAPLREYNLTNGHISVSSKNNSFFLLHGFIHFPYAILIRHGKKIYNYNIQGTYNNKQSTDLSLKINHDIDVAVSRQIRVHASRVDINVPALISFFKSHKFKSASKSASKSIYIILHHGYLYAGKNKKVLFDRLQVLYNNSIVTAVLDYKGAKANLKLDPNGHFNLIGAKFNDYFMNHIFTNSELSGGTLSFAVRGNITDYDGLIEIKDAVLKNYTILNNILAFINTVPALTSFSLPDYSTKGFPTQKMYCTFSNRNNILTLKEIVLNSKKINIYGKGQVNLKTKKLDIALNLKTNIASSLSKIPLVGYILFNKNSISTSLKITGTIYNPKIQTSIAKDIVLAPFNIIKRTFLSPFELVMPKKDFNNLF